MFLDIEKFDNRVEELGRRRFIGLQPITPFRSKPGWEGKDEVHHVFPGHIEGDTLDMNDFFVGRDRYLYVQKSVTLPEHKEGCEVYGVFNFGKTGGGLNSGFESLLYVDGEPFQGVDTYHNDVNFEKLQGKEVELTFMLWTGLGAMDPTVCFYHQLKQAHIGWLHTATDDLYYLMRAAAGTIKLLPDGDTTKWKLTTALNRTLELINWDEDKLHATTPAALEFLKGELDAIGKYADHTIICVGHTHIDVAWMWRLKHTREKAIRSFSTVLKLMDEFPEYVFMQSQPQLYKYIKHDAPELYERIKQRILEGRWEIDGGMWLEADCNITSGESLARQFLHGCRFAMNEFGKKCEYLWLPDVFGYSWALPQILKLSEIDSFVTTKISWNQFNRMPHDLFKWRGIDGTEVMSYFITTPSPGQADSRWYATYNAEIEPETMEGAWKRFQDKNIFNESLVSYGHGDGGGGVNRDMLKMRRAVDAIPGSPAVKTGHTNEFLHRAHAAIENTHDYVPMWDGELYLEYHRGTYTSQAYNKKMNRRSEFRLTETEWMSVLAMLVGGEYPTAELYECWDNVLLHQFHDIIPGSSIHEVYEDSHVFYEGLMQEIDAMDAKAESKLTAGGNAYTVVNPIGYTRLEAVFVPEQAEGSFTDASGNPLPSEKVEGGYRVFVKAPGLSVTEVRFAAGAVSAKAESFDIDMEAGKAETPFYSITWSNEGRITRIYDKSAEREVLKGEANVLELYEDKSLAHDAWDIDIYYMLKKPEYPTPTAAPQLISNGKFSATIRFEYKYNVSTIQQDMVLYADSRRIDFVTHVDWHEDHRLLKAAFAVDVRSTRATYDIQFGYAERPTHYNTSWDFARFEVVGQKWADLSETGYGVAILNNCKYGYNIKDNVMRISLLKAAKAPDYAADMGEHDFTYSLLPHTGLVQESDVITEAAALNQPLHVLAGAPAEGIGRIIISDNPAINIDAVKKAEDSNAIVVHMHECRGGRAKATLTSDYAVKSFTPCNLLEHDLGEAICGNALQTEFRPFEIKCFKLEL